VRSAEREGGLAAATDFDGGPATRSAVEGPAGSKVNGDGGVRRRRRSKSDVGATSDSVAGAAWSDPSPLEVTKARNAAGPSLTSPAYRPTVQPTGTSRQEAASAPAPRRKLGRLKRLPSIPY
jgi:hypothetical protein